MVYKINKNKPIIVGIRKEENMTVGYTGHQASFVITGPLKAQSHVHDVRSAHLKLGKNGK